MEDIDIKNKFNELEQRIEKLEDKNKNLSGQTLTPSKISNELIKKIAENIDHIPSKELTIISLKSFPDQTTSSIQKNLKKWGWSEDSFFSNHFSRALLKTGLVHNLGKNEHKAILYSLTAKGELEYEKIIQKRKLN